MRHPITAQRRVTTLADRHLVFLTPALLLFLLLMVTVAFSTLMTIGAANTGVMEQALQEVRCEV